MVIGYLSTCEKNISTDEQKQMIEQYAEKSALVVDAILTGGDVQKLIGSLQTPGHVLLLANSVGMGSSLYEIKENLKSLISRKLTIISIKEDLVIKPDENTDWLIRGMELSIGIRNSMVSTLTKNALDEKRANGIKLGREIGSKNKKRIWNGKEETIKKLLLSGSSRVKTAREVGISVVSLYHYLKQNPELRRCAKDAHHA